MESHFELSDEAFEQQFADCSLNPAIFSHEAHIQLAWIHIKKYGVEQAVENICSQLLAFVDHVGARDKYNKTLTVAAVRAVHHFMSKTDADSFADFILLCPRLKTQFKELMAAHYGIDIYHSEKAKQEYLEPDLLAFT
jgi:hypothetical protein